MLNVTVRFILAALKLIFRIMLILGGLVISSIKNAFAVFFSADDTADEETVEVSEKSFVYDKSSAINASVSREYSEARLAQFWNMEDK